MLKHLSRWCQAGLFASMLLGTAACSAQPASSAPNYTDGDEYITLPHPQRYSADGKVEVDEVFSYGCIHCAEFAPLADKLRRSLPPGVVFKLIPAAFNEAWLPFAQAYYASKDLGLVDRTHLQLFQAKFGEHYPINSLDELADFYARNGADRARFLQIANSPETMARIKRDTALIQQWQVDGTPTLIVDGKYRVNEVESRQELADVALWLAKRELAAKAK
ncbi:thiol:disulfide interchange protein DsbA/DsbL [Frateuria aurantia]|uniref:Thiol:disulfide interchange protein DsbA n=1 Tax=Frateuria aurantia (strain ATCC 33424 / DSM 6220 / KCTC 2777 / LMG 1558 / NBRC 3245 / NCIMB 13370) TaxID=767434 RepID=H8KZJ5_FRAAD|nr:thiol:disulfide interchange protein DsbA/DsbL [Frateuria aurantia]AFC87055.1 protein-disulfide isomerase [Frateuria aurantia DSM 6220]